MRCTFYPLNSRKKLRAISNIKNCDKANNKPYIERELRDYKVEIIGNIHDNKNLIGEQNANRC
jgi:hypothetical protein